MHSLQGYIAQEPHVNGDVQFCVPCLFVPSPELEEETLIPQDDNEYAKLRNKLKTVKEECGNHGVELHYNLIHPGKPNPLCTENVFSSLVVASDGEVSPCVFTDMPVSGASYLVMGKERPFKRLTFGNVNQESIFDIWKKKEFKRFRALGQY